MKRLLLLASISLICSCKLFENKETKAIEVCQTAKMTSQNNFLANALLSAYVENMEPLTT